MGLAKGCGAFMGILGTYLTPMLANRCGFRMEFIGLLTIWLFWLCLFPSGIQFMAVRVFDVNIFSGDASMDDAYIILGCMIVARCGLWAFDLVCFTIVRCAECQEHIEIHTLPHRQRTR